MFESAPGLYLVLTPDLTIVAVSDAYLHATMTNRAEILGRRLFEVIADNPDDSKASCVDNLRASLDRVRKNRAPDTMPVQRHDVRQLESEGGGFEERFWRLVNSPVLDPAGGITYIIHRVEDVTEFVRLQQFGAELQKITAELRTRAEETEADATLAQEVAETSAEAVRRTAQLQTANQVIRDIKERAKAEAKFRGLIETAPDAMVIVDREGRIVIVNRQAERLFGYERAELIGRLVEMLMPDRFRGSHPAADARYSSDSVFRPMGAGLELFGRRKDGTEVPVEISVSPLETDEGTLFSNSIRDVSERKRAEEDVRHSEQRRRLLMEDAIDAIYVSEPDGTVLEVNRATEVLQGRPRAEIIGRPVTEAVSPGERERVENAFRETLSHGSMHGLGTFALRADGKTVPIEISARVIRVDDRHLVHAIVRDVSARRQLEAQLRQSQRMETVGQLAGGVAHDFNNLLTVIIGYAELLALRADLQEAARAEIGEIRNASERAAVLTRQLLAFSRRQVLEPVVFSINELIANFEKMLRRLIGENLNLVTRLDPFLGNVRADRGQLEQVIMNLAVNARDAMPNGGKLTIETANADLDEAYAERHVTVKPGRYVMVAVSDTGTGMDAETQARIFEPFFTTKEKGKGTGLGLSTVYGIVKQSEGDIWVYSELGKGTTFKVYLPRVDEVLAQPASTTSPGVTADGHETILVVEDETAIRALTRKILEKYGYRVLDAPNGSEAEKLVSGHPEKIDLLLTDLVMPDMAGTELATRLLAKRPDLRVVLMSGYTDHAIDRIGLFEPGRAFLQKPFTPALLVRKIRDVLSPEGHP